LLIAGFAFDFKAPAWGTPPVSVPTRPSTLFNCFLKAGVETRFPIYSFSTIEKMTIRANKFTPKVLLSAPRRSAAIPNADGTLALFTLSTYSFSTHSKSAEIRVLDIKTGQSKLLSDDLNASEPTWVGEKNLVLWLKGGEKGTTSLVLADAENLENKLVYSNMHSFQLLMTIGQK